jgi:hypothetical protein
MDEQSEVEYPSLAEALEAWKQARPPKDVVPKKPPSGDAPPIPTGFGEVAYVDATEDNITPHHGTAYIAPAVMPKNE